METEEREAENIEVALQMPDGLRLVFAAVIPDQRYLMLYEDRGTGHDPVRPPTRIQAVGREWQLVQVVRNCGLSGPCRALYDQRVYPVER